MRTMTLISNDRVQKNITVPTNIATQYVHTRTFNKYQLSDPRDATCGVRASTVSVIKLVVDRCRYCQLS